MASRLVQGRQQDPGHPRLFHVRQRTSVSVSGTTSRGVSAAEAEVELNEAVQQPPPVGKRSRLDQHAQGYRDPPELCWQWSGTSATTSACTAATATVASAAAAARGGGGGAQLAAQALYSGYHLLVSNRFADSHVTQLHQRTDDDSMVVRGASNNNNKKNRHAWPRVESRQMRRVRWGLISWRKINRIDRYAG